MCGIFGVIRAGGIRDADRAAFTRLSTQLLHRGPDGSSRFEHPGALLGMHRLSIIDVESGWQPFWSEDGSAAAFANGEIYNAPEIARDLCSRGFNLRTRSDIEVLPHLYAAYGLDYVSRLRGMFAIAILDLKHNSLTLTRDRLGEKPLFFCSVEGSLWFSSEMSALIKAGIMAPKMNQHQVANYLTFGFVPEPETIISGIQRIPAGHHLVININDGTWDLRQYWNSIDFLGADAPSTEQLEGRLREAIHLNVRSDVPVAVALSGGLDSSLVASLASQARGDIHAISVGYAELTSSDESNLAGEHARDLGIPFHRVELNIGDTSHRFERVCQRRDEPIADIAGPGYDAVARAALELGFPVLLNGQGGDELFWGYSWVLRLARHARQLATEHKANPLDAIPRQPGSLSHWCDDLGGFRTNRVINECLSNTSHGSLVPLYRLQAGHHVLRHQIMKLLPGQTISGVLNYPRTDPSKYWSLFGLGMIDTYMKSNGLAQMDRLTMAHGVEGRTPLVDYQVAEYALSTMASPDALLRPPKSALRDVASRVLPSNVIARPKMGFTPPVRPWLRGIWQTQGPSLRAPLLAEFDVFNQRQLVGNIQTPIERSGKVNQVAFRLLTLELWFRGII